MQQKNSKTPLVFRVSLVLLCALVISTYMISGLYARFIITATRLGRVNVAKIDYSVNYEFSGYGSLGDVAVTAPVWLETYEDLGVEDFAAENPKPEVGTRAQLTVA